MSMFAWVKNLFKKTETENISTIDNEKFESLSPQKDLEIIQFQEQETEFPYWLSSEDSLRDEGVIFGLSDANADEKLKVIESIFNQKKSYLIKKQEEISEKLNEYNLYIEKHSNEIVKLENKSKTAEERQVTDHNLVRVLIGLAISLGMCAGNYFLIDYNLSFGMPQNHQWISWGVFLTGMFSLFNPISIFHDKDSKLNWKTILEEIGVPFAASLFVFVQVVATQPLYKSLSLFLFVFFVFLISGKILLSNIARLKTEMAILKNNAQIKNDKKAAQHQWKDEIADLERQIEAIRLEKWKNLPDLNKVEAEINKINAEKDALVGVFMSEFNLAKSYKKQLNANQIKNIIGQ